MVVQPGYATYQTVRAAIMALATVLPSLGAQKVAWLPKTR